MKVVITFEDHASGDIVGSVVRVMNLCDPKAVYDTNKRTLTVNLLNFESESIHKAYPKIIKKVEREEVKIEYPKQIEMLWMGT